MRAQPAASRGLGGADRHSGCALVVRPGRQVRLACGVIVTLGLLVEGQRDLPDERRCRPRWAWAAGGGTPPAAGVAGPLDRSGWVRAVWVARAARHHRRGRGHRRPRAPRRAAVARGRDSDTAGRERDSPAAPTPGPPARTGGRDGHARPDREWSIDRIPLPAQSGQDRQEPDFSAMAAQFSPPHPERVRDAAASVSLRSAMYPASPVVDWL
jgi:hypothetical protein